MSRPCSRSWAALLANPFEVDILQAGHVFGGDRAARGAQRGDVVEQPILGFGRQVDQQTLGQPGCRCAGIQAGGSQRGRPVGTQVDRDSASVRGRLGAEIGQCARFELDHLRLIDLVHRGAVGPGQPVGAGVQARRQDHHLPYARLYGGEQILVKVLGANAHPVDDCLRPVRRRVREQREVEFAVDHLHEEIQPDGADQWVGERVVDQALGILGRHRATRRDHGRGGAHAGGQIPAVVISARHLCPISSASR